MSTLILDLRDKIMGTSGALEYDSSVEMKRKGKECLLG